MAEKNNIDRHRESALSMQIGGDEDTSAIRVLLSTGKNLYAIKDNAVYQMQLADDIDPNRQNINIPNVNRKVFDGGYTDEVVVRILLTAAHLFDEKNANASEFSYEILEASLELTRHALDLRSAIDNLKNEVRDKEKQATPEAIKNSNFLLPSITGLDTKSHNIFMKSDKVKDAIIALFRLALLPDSKTRPKLHQYQAPIAELSKEGNNFNEFWVAFNEFANLLRNIRNSSEHGREGQQTILQDFSITASGQILPPTFELDHAVTPIRKLLLIDMLDFLQRNLIEYAEVSLAMTRCMYLTKNGNLKESVAQLDKRQRRHPHVRFARSVNINGSIHILG